MEGWTEAIVFATFSLSRPHLQIRKESAGCLGIYAVMAALSEPRKASGAASRPPQRQRFPSARRRSMPDTGLLRSDRCRRRKVGMSVAVSAAGRVGELFRGQLWTITSYSRLCFSIQDTERPKQGSHACVSRVTWFLTLGCISSNQRSVSVGEMMCLDVTLTPQMLPLASAVRTYVDLKHVDWTLCTSLATTNPATSDSSCTNQRMLTGSFKPSLLNSS